MPAVRREAVRTAAPVPVPEERGVLMHGRRRPYTDAGIKRVPCARCGSPARYQWNICSDGNLFRPICEACDVALNRLVLRWMGFKDWRNKIRRYIENMRRAA